MMEMIRYKQHEASAALAASFLRSSGEWTAPV